MVGKKAFLRTMEAVIAILLVLGFLLYILPRREVYAESTIPEGIESARGFILAEFMNNEDIRACVADAEPVNAINEANKCSFTPSCNEFMIPVLERHLLPGFDYACEICLGTTPCSQLPDRTKERSIYPGAIFMYFGNRDVRHVRIYFWRE